MNAEKPKYPPLGVAVDMVLFTVKEAQLEVLLTQRAEEPFDRHWSLPGGFVSPNESAEEAAIRELEKKAGVKDVFLEQLYTFSAPKRDPRSRVVSVAYYALVSPDKLPGEGGVRRSRWFAIGTDEAGKLLLDQKEAQAAPLAFDHQEILLTALTRIRGKLDYTPIGFQLLPAEFTLTELQQVYEAILGQPMDKRNFRAKVTKSPHLVPLESFRKGSHRPARLHKFAHKVF